MRIPTWLQPPGDRWIFTSWLLLCLGSLAMLWSVTEPLRGSYEALDPGVAKEVFSKQVLWVFVGYLALLGAARVPLRALEHAALPLCLGMIVLLALLLAVGPQISGSRRWLMLGPLRMQPAELAKITFILAAAHLLGRSQQDSRGLAVTLGTFGLMALHAGLVLKEPDLGTALVFVAIWIGMAFWYGMPGIFLLGAGSAFLSSVLLFYSEWTRTNQPAAEPSSSWAVYTGPWAVYILILLGVLYFARIGIAAKVVLLCLNVATGLGIPFFWEKLHGYQQERILTFFDPMRDQFGSGYQAIQSKVAIGSGGLFGTHYLQGTQKGLAFLPERHTDFIFSVVGEELGFFGAMVLLALFLTIILRGLDVAAEARRPFCSFVAIGVVSYLTFHVVVNVSITTGLLPVTGVPLPLLSYGGSNMLTSSILLGLLLNIGSHSFED